MTFLAECYRCHLLVRVAYDTHTTLCDYCMAREIERLEAQEVLDRQHLRHHTAPKETAP